MARLGAARHGSARHGKSRQGFFYKGSDMNKAPDFRLSSDSLALAKALESIKINETVEYQKLSSAIGRDVQGVGRSAMQQARKVVQRDHKMVFDVVRGVGLRRLDDDAIVDASDKSISVVRRGIRRAAKRLVCADYEALTKDKKTKHNVAIDRKSVV